MEIYTEVTTKELDNVLESGDLDKCWVFISSIEGDLEFENIVSKVKFGVKIGFDVRCIVNDEYERKPAYKIVTVRRRMNIPMEEFDDEVEARIKLVKDVARELYDDSFDKQEEEKIHGYEE